MGSVTNLRLATYNVERMVDGIPNPKDRWGDKEKRKSQASISAVAEILAASESDIVSLQEVENWDMLSALREQAKLRETYPYFVLVEGNDERKGFDVALLSRYPIQSFTTHRDQIIGQERGKEQYFSRDLLQVELGLPQDKTLRVFCTHFVAQASAAKARDQAWCNRKRLREAKMAAEIVERASQEEPVDLTAFLGDLNDIDGSPALNALEGAYLINSSSEHKPSWGVSKPHPKLAPSRLDHILAGEVLSERLLRCGVLDHPKDALASDHQLVYADYAVPERPSP